MAAHAACLPRDRAEREHRCQPTRALDRRRRGLHGSGGQRVHCRNTRGRGHWRRGGPRRRTGPGVGRLAVRRRHHCGGSERRAGHAPAACGRILPGQPVRAAALDRCGARSAARGRLIDLYAGVGVFGLAWAALDRCTVTTVEGDRQSSLDLAANAEPYGAAVLAAATSIERYVAGSFDARDATILLDPPRTGMSKEAATAIVQARAPRVVYVSCDVATLARDARRFLDVGTTSLTSRHSICSRTPRTSRHW